MNLQFRVDQFLRGNLTRTELLASFVDCVAEDPSSVAAYCAALPTEFAADIQQLASTSDANWITSFYPRGIASGELSARSSGSFDPTDYAIAAIRAIQSVTHDRPDSRRTALFSDAISACKQLQRSHPSDQAIHSVVVQLQYLAELDQAKPGDWDRLDEIIIGVLTAREIEQLDASVAKLLYDVHSEVDKMKWERRKWQA